MQEWLKENWLKTDDITNSVFWKLVLLTVFLSLFYWVFSHKEAHVYSPLNLELNIPEHLRVKSVPWDGVIRPPGTKNENSKGYDFLPMLPRE